MLRNRCFDYLAKCLLMTILLCGSAQILVGQTSTGASKDVWKDSATGLTWTAKDSGSNMNFNAATEYCTSLRLDGRSDWRLPTIDELEALYDRSLSKQYFDRPQEYLMLFAVHLRIDAIGQALSL